MVTLVLQVDGINSESGWLPSTRMVSWYVEEGSGIQGGVRVTLVQGSFGVVVFQGGGRTVTVSSFCGNCDKFLPLTCCGDTADKLYLALFECCILR